MNPPVNAGDAGFGSSGTSAAGGYSAGDMGMGGMDEMGGRFGRMGRYAMDGGAATAATGATTTAASTSTTAAAAATTTATPSVPTGFPGMGAGMSFGGSGFDRGGMGGFDRGGMGGFDRGGMMMGQPGSATPATGATTTTTPTAVQTAYKQLGADIQAISDKSQVTPALQAALRNDLEAINKDVTAAPSQTTLLALQSDVASLVGTLPSSASLATLQTDFTAAAASAGVTDTTLISQTFTDLTALITASNVTSSDVSTIQADLKAAGMSTTMPLPLNLGVDFNSLVGSLNYVAPAPTAATTPAATTTTTATAASTTAAATTTSTS